MKKMRLSSSPLTMAGPPVRSLVAASWMVPCTGNTRSLRWWTERCCAILFGMPSTRQRNSSYSLSRSSDTNMAVGAKGRWVGRFGKENGQIIC